MTPLFTGIFSDVAPTTNPLLAAGNYLLEGIIVDIDEAIITAAPSQFRLTIQDSAPNVIWLGGTFVIGGGAGTYGRNNLFQAVSMFPPFGILMQKNRALNIVSSNFVGITDIVYSVNIYGTVLQ